MSSELESIADRYMNPDDGIKVEERFLKILSCRMMKYIKGPDVLEMGVGTGTYTEKIINKFEISYIVDASNKLLRKQKEKFGNSIKIFNSYFEEFEPNIKFDTVLATNILEHVDDPILVLKKIKEWLNDDGKIMIIVPNANSLHRNYGLSLNLIDNLTQLSESDFKVGHKRVYTYKLLKQQIDSAGLKINRKIPTYLKFLSNTQMKNFTDIQLEGLFRLAECMNDLIEYNADIFLEVGLTSNSYLGKNGIYFTKQVNNR